MITRTRSLAAAMLLALALVACGGGKSTTTTTTTTTTAGGTAAPMNESQREAAALPQGEVAPVPPGMNCGATQPVWVNLHTKAYHEAGDPYYGRTRNGQYMCPSAAVAAGYHAAGSGASRHKHGKKSTAGY